MGMDEMVAQMVTWSRVVESTLHGDGPWTFRTINGNTPAHRIIDHSRNEIAFTGLTQGTGQGEIELWCGDEFITYVWPPYPLSPGDTLTWTLNLSPVVRT